jgi:hypothetical protein
MIEIKTLLTQNGTHTFLDELKKLHEKETSPYRKDWRIGLRRIQGHLETDSEDSGVAAHKAPRLTSGSAGTVKETRYASILPMYYPQYMRILGRVLETIKGFQCISASDDTDDRTGTYAGEMLLKEYLADHSGQYFPEVVKMVGITMSCGCCPVLVEGIPEYGLLEEESVQIPGGDVNVEACLPHDVWHMPAPYPDQSPVMCVRRRKTKKWLQSRYQGIEFPKDMAGAQWTNDSGLTSMMPGIEEALVQFDELYVLPCDELPEGSKRVVIDEKVVAEMPIDTFDGGYPVVYITDTPLGPSFYNRGRMAFLTPIQTVMDEAWSKAVEVVRKHAYRTYFLPPASNVKASDITDKSVAIVEAAMFNGQQIQTVDMPDVSPLVSFVHFCTQVMEEIGSQHGPSKGEPVGTRTPAKAVEAYIEQSEVADYTFNMLLRGSMSRIGKRILAEGQRVWPEKKIFYVLGKNRRYEAQTFQAANLRGEWDVRVAPDAGLPRNKGQRMNLLTQALKAGGLGPMDPETRMPTPIAIHRYQELMNIDTDDQIFGNATYDREIQKARGHFKALQDQARMALEMGVEPQGVTPGWDDEGPVHCMIEKQMLAEQKNAAMGGDGVPEIGLLDQLVGMHCAAHGDPAARQAFMPDEVAAEQAMEEEKALEREMLIKGNHPDQIEAKKTPKKEEKPKGD